MSWTVRLAYREEISRTDLDVPELVAAFPTTGQLGGFSVVIPKRHIAASAQYVGVNALATISHPELGTFRGIAQEPIDESSTALTVRYRDIGAWLDVATLPSATLLSRSAGVLAYVAWASATAGMGEPLLRFALPLDAAPVIPSFEWAAGQSVGEVFKLLAEQSGQEWVIRDGIVYWGAFGRHLLGHLYADPDLVFDGQTTNPADVASTVIARNSVGMEATWRNPDPAAWRWPRTQLVQSQATDLRGLLTDAETAGAGAASPLTTIRVALRQVRLGSEAGGVVTAPADEGIRLALTEPVVVSAAPAMTEPWAYVREGDYLTITLPGAGVRDTAGLYGSTGQYRVRARRYQSGSRLLSLDLQTLPPVSLATVGQAWVGQVRPPSARSHVVRAVTDLDRRLRVVEQAAG